jgi:Xaa-Pro dipeptidase
MLNKKYIDKLCGLMVKNNVDAMMIGPSVDLEFLTDFNPSICERFQAFFILSNGECFHISPQLYLEEAEKYLDNRTEIFMWRDSDIFLDAIRVASQKYHLNGKTIAINNVIRGIDLIDIKKILNAKFINGHDILENIRVIKDKDEIIKLRESAKLADEVIGETINYIRPGVTERDIKNKIEELFMQKGADGLSFEPIIASGPNSSMPHYCEDSRVIQGKDIIILDLGCKYKSYCSDISRTVFVGEITDEEKKVYDIILRANKAGEETAKQGVKAEDVDKASRDIIKSEGYGQYFLNRTGHGIGITVHEAPYIRTGNKQRLEKGMAFSVEPGIYMQNKFGMRIEDIVVVGADGPEVLNNFTKEIIVIK